MPTNCDWCTRKLPVTKLNDEWICAQCTPYAWAATVHPDYREENLALARKMFMPTIKPVGETTRTYTNAGVVVNKIIDIVNTVESGDPFERSHVLFNIEQVLEHELIDSDPCCDHADEPHFCTHEDLVPATTESGRDEYVQCACEGS